MKNITTLVLGLARKRSEAVALPEDSTATVATASGAASASLSYYLGTNTQYFSDGLMVSEFPAYAAFLALGVIAAKSVSSLCGKIATVTQLKAALGGASTGLGLASAIAGIAFSIAADIGLMGAGTLLGAMVGFWSGRNGRKRHSGCPTNLPCHTWVCPDCFRVITQRSTNGKDDFDLLEICEYLDQGSLKLNVIQALCLLEKNNLLEAGESIAGNTPVWDADRIRQLRADKEMLEDFGNEYDSFTRQKNVRTILENAKKDSEYMDSFLRSWRVFLDKDKKPIDTKRE